MYFVYGATTSTAVVVRYLLFTCESYITQPFDPAFIRLVHFTSGQCTDKVISNGNCVREYL